MSNVRDLLSKRRELEELRQKVRELEDEVGAEHAEWLSNQERIGALTSELDRLAALEGRINTFLQRADAFPGLLTGRHFAVLLRRALDTSSQPAGTQREEGT